MEYFGKKIEETGNSGLCSRRGPGGREECVRVCICVCVYVFVCAYSHKIQAIGWRLGS